MSAPRTVRESVLMGPLQSIPGPTSPKTRCNVNRGTSRGWGSLNSRNFLFLETSSTNQRNRKPVVTFASDGLDYRRIQTRFRREHLVELAHSLHIRIIAGGVNDRSLPDQVVGDDYGARA